MPFSSPLSQLSAMREKACARVMLLCLPVLMVFCQISAQEAYNPTATERALQQQGLVDLSTIDSSIQVSLMYGRKDNFLNRVLYKDIKHAYVHPETARALRKAQRALKRIRPDLSLKVYDAVRPMHIQQAMWDAVKHTPHYYYVSNPAHGGGLHNYGLAVDITLCDAKGDTLDMGSRIDYMGVAAHITDEASLVKRGIISRAALANRKLLRRVMREAGFRALPTEWWHFNLYSRNYARAHYKVIQ